MLSHQNLQHGETPMPSALSHGGHHGHTLGMQVHFDAAPVIIDSQDGGYNQMQEEYDEEQAELEKLNNVNRQVHEREDIDDEEEEEDEDRGAGEDDLKRE